MIDFYTSLTHAVVVCAMQIFFEYLFHNMKYACRDLWITHLGPVLCSLVSVMRCPVFLHVLSSNHHGGTYTKKNISWPMNYRKDVDFLRLLRTVVHFCSLLNVA